MLRRLYSASVGPKFKDFNTLKTFLNSPTWSTRSLLPSLSTREHHVPDQVIDNVLSLSGLSKNISIEERDKIKLSLGDQLHFLSSLSEASVKDSENSKKIYRLVDDNNDDYLTFEQLIEQVGKLEPDITKGEVESSWKPTSLARHVEDEYYVVNEGLIKNK
ncbi:glutamyl-tRNA(Gln) amidotransferase subunit F [Martiniozyma asiatica (nom. inval.)]|nr:glutamyl-tRNA(Gln) amidotransferase subunit F [Martiniozyma asiatica]